MPENTNDNGKTPKIAFEAAAAGQAEAAILLVESLIHGLIERAIISVGDAMDITGTAVAAKENIDADRGEGPARIRDATNILRSINASLRCDL